MAAAQGDQADAQSWRTRVITAIIGRGLADRDPALDALRGLMIMAMVFVNHPPQNQRTYAIFTHAAWHGWTIADVVFPGFLFAVGVSIGLAGQRVVSRPEVVWHLLRRFTTLMLLNFLLINFPYYFAGQVRLDGTLALIARCYLIVAAIQMFVGWQSQTALAAAFLGLQALAYLALPLSWGAIGTITPQANAALEIDRLVFGGGLGAESEGAVLLPLAGQVASTLMGVLAARWIAARTASEPATAGLWRAGAVLVGLGWAGSVFIPINKMLWTPTYALLMGGISLLVFALLRVLYASASARRILHPMRVAGSNALFFYVFAQSMQRVLVYWPVWPAGGGKTRLGAYLQSHYYVHWLPGPFGALVWAMLFLLVCYAATHLLYRHRIFIKA